MVLWVLLSACGSDGGGDPPPISVDPIQTTLVVGETVKLTAVANNSPIVWKSLDSGIATVDGNGLVMGHQIGVARIQVTSGVFSAMATIGVVSPAPGSAQLTLSGTAYYEDRVLNEFGFTGERTPKPIRWAVIHVVSTDGLTILATATTGADGAFAFPTINNSNRQAGVYLQVMAEINSPTPITIQNDPLHRIPYSFISAYMDDSRQDAFSDLSPTATVRSLIGGAFNMLDVFLKGAETVEPLCSACLPPLVAYWESGRDVTTGYDGDAIFVKGGDAYGDRDEYDDAIVAHEYGHFVLKNLSRDDSPGGTHGLTDSNQDPRLSWSEGWATFFASVVLGHPFHVDAKDIGIELAFDLETLFSLKVPSLKEDAITARSEIAVASVLYDLYDTDVLGPESHDKVTLGLAPIWQAVLQMRSGTAPTTITLFWDQLLLAPPAPVDDMFNVFAERQIAVVLP